MDLFGRKRIRQLERERDRLVANLKNESAQHMKAENDLTQRIGQLTNQVEFLVRTIRDIDEQLFKISQNADGTWARVQPNIRTLCDGMTSRKVAESNRIGDILRPELNKVYSEESLRVLKQIGKPNV